MAKSNSKYLSEYRKARKNLLQNIRRLEERGYDVSNIKVPEIPKADEIRKKHINELMRINKNRYSNVTHEVEQIKRLKTGEIVAEVKKVKGTKYKKIEKKKSDEQGKITRKLKKEIKELQEEFDRAERLGDTDEVNKIITKISITERKIKENRGELEYRLSEVERIKEEVDAGLYDDREEISITENTYYQDTDTGEYLNKDELTDKQKKSSRYILMSPTESDKAVVDKAIHDLDILALYDKKGGGRKHNQNTRDNAEGIRDFIKEQYAKDPQRTASILRDMEKAGVFKNAEYLYYDTGEVKFKSVFYNQYFGITSFNDYTTEDDLYDDTDEQ